MTPSPLAFSLSYEDQIALFTHDNRGKQKALHIPWTWKITNLQVSSYLVCSFRQGAGIVYNQSKKKKYEIL